MKFSRSDLIFDKNYTWQAAGNDQAKIANSPDSDLLNRKEGYEVLYFIQQFLKKRKLRGIKRGKRIEIIIQNYVPTSIRNRSDVESWLDENFDKLNSEITKKFSI
jgi:hypothetical protein